jgi:hypothetical protein
MISAPGAALLSEEVKELSRNVSGMIVKDVPRPSCYSPMPHPGAKPNQIPWALASLQDQLALIEKMASQEKLRPEVVEKVIGRIEKQLALLLVEEDLKRLGDEQRSKAKAMHEKVKALLADIKNR